MLTGDIQKRAAISSAAIEAWRRAQELEPSRRDSRRASTTRERRAGACRDAGSVSIDSGRAAVTRAELAALVGVRLETWIPQVPPTSAGLITDTREHWAQRWILAVTRAGLMEVYPNHTFQPGDSCSAAIWPGWSAAR